MQQDGLEAALAATAEQVDAAQRAASSVAKELKKAAAGATTGDVRELRRALAAAADGAAALVASAAQARDSYDFDETDHLASGRYTKELLSLAGDRGVTMYEEDDRLLCYPSLLRVLPSEAAIEVDRRKQRRLRPSVVVDALAKVQTRAPRFRAEPFLEGLARAYELLAQGHDKPDPVLRLDAVWGVFTLLPGLAKDYTKPEFARDLYLLDQSRLARTRSGRTLRFHASSGTRGAGVLTTVAVTGQRQLYWGVSFTPR